jgi:hypothetical protein
MRKSAAAAESCVHAYGGGFPVCVRRRPDWSWTVRRAPLVDRWRRGWSRTVRRRAHGGEPVVAIWVGPVGKKGINEIYYFFR